MGNCFSHQNNDRPSPPTNIYPNSNGNSVPSSFMTNHRMLPQMNVYKDESLIRHGGSQPALFHVNGSHILNSNNSNTMPNHLNRNGSKVVALFDYDSRVNGDISFKKDDIMILEDERYDFFF
uniref:SH3 domain-containing protein n=1 Tax=Panagrolaimus sp. JU765 TaxID=591449 RepID=A0AC34PY06_9BILA